MNEQQARSIIHDAVEKLYDEESRDLGRLYAMPVPDLKLQEKDTLSVLSMDMEDRTSSSMRAVLRQIETPLPSSTWQQVFEAMPQLSYRFIQWDSFVPENLPQYQQQVTPQEYDKINSGKTILIAAGILAVGSIVLLHLKISGLPRPIPLLVLVTAAVAGVVGIRKCLAARGSATQPQPRPQPQPKLPPQNPMPAAQDAVQTAHQENLRLLREWCDKLETEMIEKWRGAAAQ